MAWRTYRTRGMFLGLATTLLVAALHVAGVLQSYEMITLDSRQRQTNRLEVEPRIAHVDIDDSALEQVGPWPWRRDVVADLIRTIAQCGATGIAVDLLYSEPQQARTDAEFLQRDPGGIEGALPEELPPGPVRVVNPDAVLGEAIRGAGNVLLGVQVELAPTRSVARRQLQVANGPAARERARIEARECLVRLLTKQFAATPGDLRDAWRRAIADLMPALGDISLDIDQFLAGAKRDAAADIAWAALQRDPAVATIDALLQSAEINSDPLSRADRRDLVAGLQRARARAAVAGRCVPLTPEMAAPGGAAPIKRYDPPFYVISAAAKGFGAVTVAKDSDGQVRRLPLAVQCESRLLPHLGFAVAAELMDLDLSTLRRATRSRFEIDARAGGTLLIPVDDEGSTLLHWSPGDRQWARQPRHVAAGRVLQAADHIRAASVNITQQAERMVILATLVNPPAVVNGQSVYSAECRANIERIDGWRDGELNIIRGAAQPKARRDPLLGISGEPEPVAADAKRQLDGNWPAALHGWLEVCEKRIRDEVTSFADQPPQDDEERTRLAALRQAVDPSKGIDVFAELTALNRQATIESERAGALANELRGRLAGKFVFVGYTATAQGDIVPTAIDSTLPGVIAHATLANALLQLRPLTPTPAWLELLIILWMGVAATFVTARRGILFTILFTLGLLAAYTAAACLGMFMWLDRYVVLVAPLLAAFLTSVSVTFLRWWTTERQRREIRAQFGQYTSRALANRIADDPEAMERLSRVENRDVTCYFSDLKGFTTLAEQSDPARVRAVLNLYLDRMSEALDRHEALINKFMGDGIFAFFNPSVLPKPDHPRVAITASLECIAALRDLRERHGHPELADLIERFEMRIGLASGTAGVGDFGSSRKKDYTVIGDVVNLAARLEPANKVFGTALMVSGPTRDACADAFEFRYLAELQVKGKQKTVPVFEVLGAKGSVADDELKWALRFAEGVELYKAGKFDDCLNHFSRMLARRFDDPGCAAYIAACEEKIAFPPEGAWVGALELKEK